MEKLIIYYLNFMKRKSDYHFFRFVKYKCSTSAIYYENIVRVIEEINKQNASLKLSDAEFEYDSLEELKEKCSNTVDDLKIEARFDGIHEPLTIEIDIGGISLKAPKEGLSLALWYELKNILKKRTTWYRQIFSSNLVFILLTIFIFTGFKIINGNFFTKQINNYLFLFIVIITIMNIYSASLCTLRPKVYTKTRQELGTYFSRNSDALITGLVCAIAGAFFSYLFLIFFKI